MYSIPQNPPFDTRLICQCDGLLVICKAWTGLRGLYIINHMVEQDFDPDPHKRYSIGIGIKYYALYVCMYGSRLRLGRPITRTTVGMSLPESGDVYPNLLSTAESLA